MFCYNCGKQLRAESKFCEYCGTPTVKKSETVNNADLLNTDQILNDILNSVPPVTKQYAPDNNNPVTYQQNLKTTNEPPIKAGVFLLLSIVFFVIFIIDLVYIIKNNESSEYLLSLFAFLCASGILSFRSFILIKKNTKGRKKETIEVVITIFSQTMIILSISALFVTVQAFLLPWLNRRRYEELMRSLR